VVGSCGVGRVVVAGNVVSGAGVLGGAVAATDVVVTSDGAGSSFVTPDESPQAVTMRAMITRVV
jgi:hypothetical protein